MKEVDYENIALRSYTAALIDGEGSVMLIKKSANEFRSPCVSVTNTSYELIEFLKNTYGGTVSKQKTYQPHHRPAWVWKITNCSALKFLAFIFPYMRELSKRIRTSYLLDNYPKVTLRNGKYSNKQLITKLNFEEQFFLLSS